MHSIHMPIYTHHMYTQETHVLATHCIRMHTCSLHTYTCTKHKTYTCMHTTYTQRMYACTHADTYHMNTVTVYIIINIHTT